MANRFWVNTGGGTWNNATTTNWSLTTGGTTGASVPGASDTAIFDANSGSATITTNYAVSLSALTLDTGFAGTLTFGATNTFTTSGLITFTSGTLNTNGQTVSILGITSVNSNVRTLTLGSSAITCTGGGTEWNFSTATNLTATSNTATVTLNGAAAIFNGPINWNGLSVVLSGSGAASVSGTCTLASLTRTGTAALGDTFIIAATTITVTSSLTLTGSTVTSRILVLSSTVGTQRTFALGTLGTGTLSNVDFQDIQVTGTHTPLTATSLGDCLGNAGITFTTPATQTWSGNTTGSWVTVGNWTSRVPLPQDNVVINGLTSGTITANMPRSGANVDFTGSTGGALTVSVTWSMFGNLTLASGMSLAGSTQAITFAGRGSQTITSNTVALGAGLAIQAPGGSYTLQDNFTYPAANTLFHTVGTLNANGHNVTGGKYQFSSATFSATLTMGSGTWTMNGTGTVVSVNPFTNWTLNAGTATLLISDTSSTAKAFSIPMTGSYTYPLISISGGGTGAVSISSATGTAFSGAGISCGAPKTLTLLSGATFTVSQFTATGSSGNVITINASTPGSQATLSKSSGIVSCDWLNLTDSNATGGAAWYAGANSIGATAHNNTGWIFTVPPSGGFFDFM